MVGLPQNQNVQSKGITITALTCACSRPEAWALCESYMKRQTIQPIQWLVLDDDNPKSECTLGQDYHYWPDLKGRGSMTKKIRRALELNLIKGDAIAFIENDDYYAPKYIERLSEWLQGFDLVGEGRAVYYNVQYRFWFDHGNLQHSSLCGTAIKRSLFHVLNRSCNTDDPFVDWRVWRAANVRKRVYDPVKQGERLVIGIKGMPGKAGYGTGHKIKDISPNVIDKDLSKLTSLIGDDAKAYEKFYVNGGNPIHEPLPPPAKTMPESKAEYGHAPNWRKWLAHLKDKPAVGLELGTFKGESAEWALKNIYTHPDSKFHCVDTFEGSIEHKVHKIDCSENEKIARERLADFANVSIHKMMSHEFLKSSKEQFDSIYIDAAHDAMNVLRDSILSFELLKVGGTIIFDDYGWTAMPKEIDRPKMAIDAFLACYAQRIQLISKGFQVCIKKIN